MTPPDSYTTLPFAIDELQGRPGQTFRLGGEEVLLVCRGGEATFPQGDRGWEALRQHDFEEHERIKHYDWTELHGQRVTILVVQREIEPNILDESGLQTELVARTDDGAYYFLPFSFYDRGDAGDFKWRPQRDGLVLLGELSRRDTPSGPALLSSGSENKAGSPAAATATKKAAKAGSR